jgi:hypothetical protein
MLNSLLADYQLADYQLAELISGPPPMSITNNTSLSKHDIEDFIF